MTGVAVEDGGCVAELQAIVNECMHIDECGCMKNQNYKCQKSLECTVPYEQLPMYCFNNGQPDFERTCIPGAGDAIAEADGQKCNDLMEAVLEKCSATEGAQGEAESYTKNRVAGIKAGPCAGVLEASKTKCLGMMDKLHDGHCNATTDGHSHLSSDKVCGKDIMTGVAVEDGGCVAELQAIVNECMHIDECGCMKNQNYKCQKSLECTVPYEQLPMYCFNNGQPDFERTCIPGAGDAIAEADGQKCNDLMEAVLEKCSATEGAQGEAESYTKNRVAGIKAGPCAGILKAAEEAAAKEAADAPTEAPAAPTEAPAAPAAPTSAAKVDSAAASDNSSAATLGLSCAALVVAAANLL